MAYVAQLTTIAATPAITCLGREANMQPTGNGGVTAQMEAATATYA